MKTRTSYKSVLHIDIETYCKLDLRKVGVHAYAEHPSFSIILISYAVDEGDVKLIDLTKEDIPDQLWSALESSEVLKVAHNASFEMTCFGAYSIKVDETSWLCTMALANRLGLPASLASLSKIIVPDRQKLSTGTSLISYFSKPDKNGRRRLPIDSEEAMDKWEAFCEYCIRDTEVARDLYYIINKLDVSPDFEDELFDLDYRINKRGIKVDTCFVESALAIADAETNGAMEELKAVTGLDNPNSVAQFKDYLASKGIEIESLTKDLVEELSKAAGDTEVREATRLRLITSKASLKKYDAIKRAVCADRHIRGMFQYYGANRTGRWAGRLVQLQNLKRNSIPDLELAREAVKEGNAEDLKWLYEEDTTEILGQLIRTALVPTDSGCFIVSDFSAIEARVLAWLAGETWKTKVFSEGKDVYKASYSKAFKVPIDKVTKDMRQVGKTMELALGYGGGTGSMLAFGADKLLSEPEMRSTIRAWRRANAKIVTLWGELESACTDAIAHFERQKIVGGKLEIYAENQMLRIKLPSGRVLTYIKPKLDTTKWADEITYMDYGQKAKRVSTYGGKLTENVTQAIARDLLAEAMLRLDRAGYKIRAHVHDEVIIDAPEEEMKRVEEIMCVVPDWAKGCVINAESYTCPYYYKD